jgi:hypothetical protein
MARKGAGTGGSPSDRNEVSGLDRRRLRIALIVFAALGLVGAASLTAFALWPRHDAPAVLRAVIVDQLAHTDPNPQFVEHAARQLEAAGFKVDYYQPSEVTVDFYRDLPRRGYKFIILRSHSTGETVVYHDQTANRTASSGIFTNELYSRATHLEDQHALTADLYVGGTITDKYFGITPTFIAQNTRGDFTGATVLLMGCAGLKTDDLALAFVAKGATSFISWDDSVTATHTDLAAEKLLANLFDQHLDVKSAVAKTAEQIGPDPSFGGRLRSYP